MSNNKTVTLNDIIYKNNKMEIGGDFTVTKQQGFIRNLIITPRENMDSMYKFQIKYIDGNDSIQEPEEWYSGFKEFPAKNGDYIIFNYKKNGKWNNVKEILDVKNTHEDVTEEDSNTVLEVENDIKNPKINSDMEGECVTLSNKLPLDRLSEPYRALLLNGTINLCTRRGTLTHDEVVAQYIRFLKIINE